MPAPISADLRERIIQKRESKKTIKKTSEELSVSESTVKRITRLNRTKGNVEPKAMGGDRRSHKIKAYSKDLITILDKEKDLTIAEIRKKLLGLRGTKAKFSISFIGRFF